MSAECYSSLNCLSPDGISDDDFAERPSFASGGEFFDDETHLESEGRDDDFKVDDLLMDSNWGDFLSAESKKVSLRVQSLFEHFIYASELTKGISSLKKKNLFLLGSFWARMGRNSAAISQEMAYPTIMTRSEELLELLPLLKRPVTTWGKKTTWG
jgi:hypothetical protein